MEPLFEPEHVVIITGASSGIGQQAARLFAKKRVTKFCLTALDDLEETKKLCIEENGSLDIVMVAGIVLILLFLFICFIILPTIENGKELCIRVCFSFFSS